MSTQERKPISQENMPTIVAVAFILVLLNFAFSVHNHRQIKEVAAFYGKISVMSAKKTGSLQKDVGTMKDLQAQVDALETRLQELEAAEPADEE